MMKKLSNKLILITILVAVLGLGFIILEESETEVSINGVACNNSSTAIWLATSEGERTGTTALDPGQCTNFFLQDVEAIKKGMEENRPEGISLQYQRYPTL